MSLTNSESVSLQPPEANVTEPPLTVIEPSRSWLALDLGSLWAYRELLYFLTWRDVKVRYKQTALGVAWAVLQPLCAMLVFSLFFGRLAGVPSDGVPYPLFAFAGLLPWVFFSNAVSNSGNSLVGSANLITKVYFPRLLVPGAAVGAGLVDLAIGFALLAPLTIYYGAAPSWGVLLLPFLVVLLTLLALGVGLLTSALNVKYRDIRYALPFIIQLWMFVSPVIYPASFVPAKWRWVLWLNPLAGIIEGFRAALFNKPAQWDLLGAATVLTLALLIFAAFIFRRMEKSFADVV
jgi:lipopolysaccharide transport system permease protein